MEVSRMLLQLNDVHVAYGMVPALRGINLHVQFGEIVTIIGANGAGKTTTLRTISGLNQPCSGMIHFDGEQIDKLAADRIVARGVAHVPEGRRIFPEMTVEENLRTGAYLRNNRSEVQTDLERMYGQFHVLKERRFKNARTLSGGEQQMLAIARALMAKPKLLLLDEPSMGLAPIIVKIIGRIISGIKDQGVSIILVEQNAEMALELADYAYVLENGKIALEGKANELRDNEQVKAAYLGV